MTLTNSHISRRARFGQNLRRTTIAAAALTVGLLSFSAGGASAQNAPELPVNALAPDITMHADEAVVAYDAYVASEDLADYLIFAEHRTMTARLAARQLGYDEFSMIDAWKNTTLDHQRAVLATMTQIGVPYQTNTSVEDEGFDCSGLTHFAWGEVGVDLLRISGEQINASRKVDRAEAQAGYLVHYPGHVMMYLGVDNAVVHSVNTGRTVEIDTISSRKVNSVTFGDPLT